MLWLRQLVTGLSLRRPGFVPGSLHVGFVVDKVALEQVSLHVFLFFVGSGGQYHCSVAIHTLIIWGMNSRLFRDKVSSY
jgi:hypothetical protein